MSRTTRPQTAALKPVAARMNALAAAGRLNPRNADKHWLYQNSVQNPEVEVQFIDRVFAKEFGRKPTLLREDFCGTALLCSWWVKARATNRALGVDYDGPTLAWGRVNNLAPLGAAAERVDLVQDDVRHVRAPKADVLMAANFSWWGFKTRDELAVYLRNCRASLKPEGLLVMDCYGGPEAQVEQEEQRDQGGFTYVWDQDHYNPITGEVRCLIHFDFPDGSRMKKAFTYDWRLWQVPETCDLLRECGFSKVLVYWEGTDRKGEPNGVFRVSRQGDRAPAWIAYLVAVR